MTSRLAESSVTIHEYCDHCDCITEQVQEVIYGVTFTTCMSCVEQPTFNESVEHVMGWDQNQEGGE